MSGYLTKKSFTHSLVCFMQGVFWESQCILIKFFFSETNGHQIFTATMCKHRFTFLNAFLTFDNPEQRRELWKSDRFAAARNSQLCPTRKSGTFWCQVSTSQLMKLCIPCVIRSISDSIIEISQLSMVYFTSH